MKIKMILVIVFIGGSVVSSGIWSALYGSLPQLLKITYVTAFISGGYLLLRTGIGKISSVHAQRRPSR